MTWLLSFVLLAQPAAASSQPPDSDRRAAVLTVGEDPLRAGALQRELERRVAAMPGVVSLSVAASAARIGVKERVESPTPSPEIAREAATLLDDAIDSYYQGEFGRALDGFARLKALQEQSGEAFPLSKRIQVLLWRTAAFLSLDDADQAEIQAIAAITLDPNVRVDPRSEVPPSVQQVLDQVRASDRVELVTVLVNGLPPVAEITCGGRSVPSRFKVVPGTYRIIARSPGRRAVALNLDVKGNTSLRVSLPIALDARAAAAVATLARGEQAQEASDAVAQVAARLGVDWLVLADAEEGGTASVAVFASDHGGGAPGGRLVAASGSRNHETAGRWLSSVMPRVVAGGNGMGAAPGEWRIHASTGILTNARHRTLSGSGGGKLETVFAGSGPRFSAEVSRARAMARLEAEWVFYGMSTLAVDLPDGTRRSADGGSTLAVRTAAGYRHPLGNARSATASLGLDVERHQARDVHFANGTPMRLLTGYTRIAPELRIGAAMRLLDPLEVAAEIGIAPMAWVSESPAGATGESPTAGPALGWRADVSWDAGGRWILSGTLTGSMRSTRFSGEAGAPVDPPLRNARVDESIHGFALTAGTRF